MSPGLKCFTLVPHTALQLLSPIRRYYSQSLELNPDQNARAAFGLVLCTTAINAGGRGGGGRAEDKTLNGPLYECGRQLVLDHYADAVRTDDPVYPTAAAVRGWLGA